MHERVLFAGDTAPCHPIAVCTHAIDASPNVSISIFINNVPVELCEAAFYPLSDVPVGHSEHLIRAMLMCRNRSSRLTRSRGR
jgi:hypothetical protein